MMPAEFLLGQTGIKVPYKSQLLTSRAKGFASYKKYTAKGAQLFLLASPLRFYTKTRPAAGKGQQSGSGPGGSLTKRPPALQRAARTGFTSQPYGFLEPQHCTVPAKRNSPPQTEHRMGSAWPGTRGEEPLSLWAQKGRSLPAVTALRPTIILKAKFTAVATLPSAICSNRLTRPQGQWFDQLLFIPSPAAISCDLSKAEVLPPSPVKNYIL